MDAPSLCSCPHLFYSLLSPYSRDDRDADGFDVWPSLSKIQDQRGLSSLLGQYFHGMYVCVAWGICALARLLHFLMHNNSSHTYR